MNPNERAWESYDRLEDDARAGAYADDDLSDPEPVEPDDDDDEWCDCYVCRQKKVANG